MKPRIVFLRGGGLGDFILTLPLLRGAHLRQCPVTLYARSCYLELLGKGWDWLEGKDLDELSGNPPSCVEGSIAVSFWTDSQWAKEMIEAGAVAVHQINPRPSWGKHFVIQVSEKMGWGISEEFLNIPILGDFWKGGENTLWIHPGSGGVDKNLPIEHFIDHAHKWLDRDRSKNVIFSFGEADQEWLPKIKSSPISKDSRISIMQPLTIFDLCHQLVTRADKFMGNDSGPGHLAASLGIPVEIGFTKTAESVWRPLGPRVKTYFWDSVSSKIL
ncbi:MAG: glycosyltransferase family 9 protein [Opitutae bacterium]